MRYSHLFLLSSALIIAGCAKSDPLQTPTPVSPKGDRIEAQPADVPNWFTKDTELEGVEGTSADRAYKDLNLKVGVKPVIVAVIDSGVDIDHEDLAGRIWTNTREIPDNGRDDDGNGYVDDVHGWNFLGTVDFWGNRKNVESTTLEMTRELVKMKALKKEREFWGLKLSAEEQSYLDELNTKVTTNRTAAQKTLDELSPIKANLEKYYTVLKTALGDVAFADLTLAKVEALNSVDPAILDAKAKLIAVFKDNKLTSTARLVRVIESVESEIKYYYNENFNPRRDIMHDNQDSVRNRFYGNNDVKGAHSDHGTHVSGMIAAVRGNGIGIDGIASDVLIMPIRAVPDGDEYDKDVANAVRYAVDNGAQIINMSFGKAYSPHKEYVDAAFQYAEAHDVLVVHAAGNDNADNDTTANFPNKKLKTGQLISTWLEVGASSANKGLDLPAVFSNYGKHTVDIFAPGVKITSTVPDKNKYATFSGTSMASPSTAGVAALVLSQRQKLTARQLRELLLKNTRQYIGLQVHKPFDGEGDAPLILFSDLSITGGIVNAYATLRSMLQL